MNRDQLEAELHRTRLTPYEVTQVLDLVDAYTDSLTEPGPELWTAEQVAAYLGYSSAHGARSRMSVLGIKAVQIKQIPGQRAQSYYDATKIIALKEGKT